MCLLMISATDVLWFRYFRLLFEVVLKFREIPKSAHRRALHLLSAPTSPKPYLRDVARRTGRFLYTAHALGRLKTAGALASRQSIKLRKLDHVVFDQLNP
jgi:hypothetical protein